MKKKLQHAKFHLRMFKDTLKIQRLSWWSLRPYASYFPGVGGFNWEDCYGLVCLKWIGIGVSWTTIGRMRSMYFD